jgi:replicative DNA helicase
MGETLTQLPPMSIEAEQAYLASLMMWEGDKTELVESVSADDFYQDDHKVIFQAICGGLRAGRPVDSVAMRGLLGKDLEAVGGIPYIATILDCVPSIYHWAEYARRVRETAARRRLMSLAEGIRAQALLDDPNIAADEIFVACKKRFSEIESGCSRSKPLTLNDAATAYIEKLEAGEERLLPMGVQPLDDVLGGILPGEIWILGARPSMGKSTTVRQMAFNLTSIKIPVAYYSLEENPEKMARNMLSMVSGIENKRLRVGLHKEDRAWESLIAALPRMNIPLYIETQARTISQIRASVASLINRCGVKVMFIDYMGLVSGFRGSPYEVASQQSSGIADIAKSLNIPAIVPVQLSRSNTGRDDKRPTMADIRDSGRIEQDADGIIFIHREDYYHRNDQSYTPTQITEFIVAKFRDGERGQTITMKSNLKYQRFEECAQTEYVTTEQM